MTTHAPGSWYLAPASDPADEFAAGYDGNTFGCRAEALAELPHLVAAFAAYADADDVDPADWIAVQREEVRL